MDLKLQGKVVLVTGAGSGIGRGTALLFAAEGAKVAAVDVNQEPGEETVRLIRADGGDATFVQCDVANVQEVTAMVQKTVETYGRLDCAFNNAGIAGLNTPVVEYDEEVWDRVVAINLKGVWLCMKAEIPQMLKQGGGAIVNTASVAGHIGTAGATGYTASKHGVVGLTKTVALEYAKAGIRINAISPGAIHTDMIDKLITEYPQMKKFYEDVHPIGRIGRIEEVAGAVVWLCSPWASFMIGHSMIIDGGLTLP
jgi:NAD(P)-dependent dehydrogenase (short-subunit alcohol dehydrogenase family)